jgi:hypothetical protein
VDASSDHRPIFLQIKNEVEKPPSPFKLNHVLLQEEDFRQLVLENWCFLDPNSLESTLAQFVAILNQV